MKLKIMSLTLDHFKGVRNYELAANGANADIFGDNATGKTTVADAYFWLLFGKDSTGKSDFGVLPTDKDGNIISGVEASVTGKFTDEAGKEFTLRRAYHQVFTRKNGEAEKKFKGNTTDFYIDDVPKPQKDYQNYVAAICDEQTFQLLSDPDMFPGKMKWTDRRDLLIRAFAADMDDRQVISSHEALKPLLQYIGGKSVEDYAEITTARRRAINDELRDIPGRIDEAEHAKPADLPLPGDTQEMLQLSKQKMKLEGDIARLRNGEAAAALRKQVAEVQAKIAKSGADYNRMQYAGSSGIQVEAAQLRSKIAETESRKSTLSAAISGKTAQISDLDCKMNNLREQCRETAAREFDSSNNICPLCGQEYPPEKQKQMEADFNNEKAERLGRMEAQGKQCKAEKETLEKGREDIRRQFLQADTDLADLKARLEKTMQQYTTPAPFESTDEYKTLAGKLSTAEQQLASILSASEKRVAEFQDQLSGVVSQLEVIKKRALNKDAAARQDQRKAELMKQESQLSQELAIHYKGLLLAEQFTQQKARDIEAKVNSEFKLVRWKLFDTQVNGGVKPCCEATVDGILYGKDLNSAAKMNAGLDIINTLGRIFGTSVPVWIDNAESVTKFFPIDTQVIRLHVSAGDKQLRTEVQDEQKE